MIYIYFYIYIIYIDIYYIYIYIILFQRALQDIVVFIGIGIVVFLSRCLFKGLEKAIQSKI